MNISLVLDVRVRATLLAGLLWAIPAGGQMQNGEIVGLVTDVSGAVISNATVKIMNLETNRNIVVRSNSSGLYTAGQLTAGRVRPHGFSPGFCDLQQWPLDGQGWNGFACRFYAQSGGPP